MKANLRSNIPNLLLLIKPRHFGFNEETASTNLFQKRIRQDEVQKMVNIEVDGAIAKLLLHEIEIKLFEDMEVQLPDAVFSNNWMAATPGDCLTLFPMQAKSRQAEVRADITDWVMENTTATELVDLQDEGLKNRFLEGTGSIVFDHFNKCAYACESPRTSISLFEEYCQHIGYSPASFESLDLSGAQIYHTNVMLSIAEKYCIINLDSIENTLERSFCQHKLLKAGKEIIPITHMQMNAFAGNVLEVNNKHGQSHLIMSDSALSALHKNQIARIEKYSTIISVDVKTIEQVGGGGIRCMLTGLFV